MAVQEIQQYEVPRKRIISQDPFHYLISIIHKVGALYKMLFMQYSSLMCINKFSSFRLSLLIMLSMTNHPLATDVLLQQPKFYSQMAIKIASSLLIREIRNQTLIRKSKSVPTLPGVVSPFWKRVPTINYNRRNSLTNNSEGNLAEYP